MKLSKDDHIDNIEMSVSSDSALKKAGLDTVGQFLDLTQLQVVRLPEMGRKNWKEISEIQDILAKEMT
jgi:DNA-directed RNA polymerase alpha subunit